MDKSLTFDDVRDLGGLVSVLLDAYRLVEDPTTDACAEAGKALRRLTEALTLETKERLGMGVVVL